MRRPETGFLPRLEGTARRILVVLKGGLPEAILAGGLLEGLRLRHPRAQIVALAPARHALTIQRHPALSGVLTLPELLELKLGLQAWTDPAVRQVLETIRAWDFDLAIAPSPWRDALVDLAVLASGAAIRVGWQTLSPRGEHEVDGQGWDAFYTHLLRLEHAPYAETDRYRHVATSLGLDPGADRLAWPRDEAEVRTIAIHLAKAGRDVAWVGLWCGPGDATGFRKWREALRLRLFEQGMGLMLLGYAGLRFSMEESEAWSGLPVLDMRGCRLAGEMLEAVAHCRAVLGVEGPWVHLCAARSVPHVVLAGGEAFGRHAPLSPLATAVCHPMACYFCGGHCDQGGRVCLRRIPPEAVSEALRRALERSGDRPRLLVCPNSDEDALDLDTLLAEDAFERLAWPPA